MPTESQDIVTEARDFVVTSALYKNPNKARGFIEALCNEVERLREQWNTRFNTLCGLCGKRYLGPRDEYLHGYGRCDKKVSNVD